MHLKEGLKTMLIKAKLQQHPQELYSEKTTISVVFLCEWEHTVKAGKNRERNNSSSRIRKT